jgi:hypothetical protein
LVVVVVLLLLLLRVLLLLLFPLQNLLPALPVLALEHGQGSVNVGTRACARARAIVI